MDISKAISNFLREKYSLGASHAREVTAAFLGYKSHSAYLADNDESNYTLDGISDLIPDIDGLEKRIEKIANLPTLPASRELAQAIGDDLKAQNAFRGTVLVARDLEEFESLMWTYLKENVTLEDELSGEMAMTNANGFMEYYNEVKVSSDISEIFVEASGTFTGENDDDRDKPNHGEVIDFSLKLRFELRAWRAGFSKKVEVTGKVRSPY